MILRLIHTEGFFVALIFLLVLASFSPLLFGGYMFFEQERLGAFYPMAFFYQQALETQQSFLWNPYYYGGFPSYLTVFGGFLYPVHYLLFSVFTFVTAYHVAISLAVFGGMAFSYLFGRKSGFSKTGSLILAASYATGQTFSHFTAGLSYANGFMVLPIFFLALLLGKDAKTLLARFGAVLLGGIGVGIGFLAGFPHTVLYGLTFAFFYALFLDYEEMRRSGIIFGEKIVKSFSATFSYLCMILLGVLIGTPQLIPMLDLKEFSIRAHGYAAYAGSGISPLELVTFILPDAIKIPFLVHGTTGFYIGTLSLFFAVSAILFFRSRRVWFFSLSYLFMFLMALGVPPLSWVNDYLPIFSRVSGPARWLMIGVFSLGYLAAAGFEGMAERLPEFKTNQNFQRFLKGSGVVALFIFLVLSGSAIFVLFLSGSAETQKTLLSYLLEGRDLRLPHEHYFNVFARSLETLQSTFSFSDISFLLIISLFPLGLFILHDFYRNGLKERFRVLVIAFVIGNTILAAYAGLKDYLVPAAVLLEEPMAARVMKGGVRSPGGELFRFMPFLAGDFAFREIFAKRNLSAEEQAIVQRELLFGQIGTLYGIQGAWGFEPLRSRRMQELVDFTISSTGSDAAGDLMDRLPLLSMMNVKYIFSPLLLEDPRIVSVEIPPNPHLSVPFYLYENKEFLPRVYFAKNSILWRDSEKELLSAVIEEKDFQKNTYIECRDCRDAADGPGENKISVLRYGNGILELEAESDRGGWLVFSESHLPGWIAEIDPVRSKTPEASVDALSAHRTSNGVEGKRLPIYTANYLFQSVFVPAGAHHVVFEYKGAFDLILENITSVFGEKFGRALDEP